MLRFRPTAILVGLALLLAAPVQAAVVVSPLPVGTYAASHSTSPVDIAFRADGTAYVVCSFASRVDVYSRMGTKLFSFGTPGTGPGQFQTPAGIALAGDGSVWVTDAAGHRVQHFTAAGVYLGQFGSHGSGPGQFDAPRGIAIDAAGNLYVADGMNDRIEKFGPGGTYLQQFGGTGQDEGRLLRPIGVALDGRGRIYVADSSNHRIEVFDASGAFLRQWGSQGPGDGQFQFPVGIDVDPGGNVWVADPSNFRVERFTSTGVFLQAWGTGGSGEGQFSFPQGVAVDAKGDVHVADSNNDRIQVFRFRSLPGHESVVNWGSFGSGNAQFDEPRGVAVAPDGFVFVVDGQNQRVQKFTPFGAWAAAFGSAGSGNGRFNQPAGVAVSKAGIVYVTDVLNARVQRFDETGTYLGQWGTSGFGAGQFFNVWDVAVDSTGNVYVTDADRVQKFTSTGGYLTSWACSAAHGIACDPEGGVWVTSLFDHVVRHYGPDGTPRGEFGSFGSGPGQFDTPHDVACDSSGAVYVTDSAGRVERFSPLTHYVAEWGQPGTGSRDLGLPLDIAIDPSGSVYVTEHDNDRVHKFVSPADLIWIADVPSDNGDQAQLFVSPSSAEAPQSGAGDVQYRIVRVPDGPGIGTVLVYYPPGTVTTTVAMDAHATDRFTGLRELQLQCLLPIPGSFGLVCTNLGFVTDDIPPDPPQPFTGVSTAGPTDLHWPVSAAPDFATFKLYRSPSGPFTPGAATFVLAQPDTGWADPGPPRQWYAITALDTSGNSSAPTVLSPDQTVGAPDGLGALALAFDPPRPNPARGACVLHFVLPDEVEARVELVNVAGRTAWSQAVRGAGPHAVRAAGQRLAPGLYFARLVHGRSTLVRRVVVLD